MPGAIPELWRQQGEILAAYAMDFESNADVAVELPTGTGKTMVGLLIADWRRRKYRRPVLYACPTQQLAHQVTAATRREGMPCVTLIGSHKAWPAIDKSRYDAGEALGISTYSSIFNAAPKVGAPGTIVFDDAHAAEQYVAECWAIAVDRARDTAAYEAILMAVRPGISGMFYDRMEQTKADVRARSDVKLLVPSRHPKMLEALGKALSQLTEGSSAWWAWNTVRPGLASCLVYVSWREILIRPFIPPTSENEPYETADQRIYLSATPGHAGELERSFGRSQIDRLLLPDGRTPRSGRRFFLFTRLTATDDKEGLAAEITADAGKALVLGTSTETAQKVAKGMNPMAWSVLGKDEVEADLDVFANLEHGILALAGRYDGIDLPDDACRLVCLVGLPEWAHLQERFLASNLRARAALEERTRTRVVQGAGRATRNPLDHAIVLIVGGDLTRYLTSPIVRQSLDADLQAEVEFGLENSRETSADDVLENASVFLEQGDVWRDNAEPFIAEARRTLNRVDPAGSDLLAASAPHEVEACTLAFRSDFLGARESAYLAASALSGEESVRSYRAFWLYFAAMWSFAATGTDPSAGKTAAGLLREAHKAAKGTTWLREADAGGPTTVEEDADDTPAVNVIAKRLSEKMKRSQLTESVERMRVGIDATDHKKSEPAITELGRLLGAESFKPGGQGRADSVWCWEERVWIAIEAKSEETPAGELPLRDVRQANTQLSQLSEDRGVGVPMLAAVVIVSPRQQVADEAVTAAQAEVHLARQDVLRSIGDDIASCWDKLLLTYHGHTGKDLEALIRGCPVRC